jgi:adenylate cyclase
MGDTVNLASRLEGACKHYKVSILVGEETFARVKEEVVARPVDTIRVVGKRKPVSIYEIIGEKSGVGAAELEKFLIFEQARKAYQSRDWEKALGLFGKLKDDPVAMLYMVRCEGLKQSPPPGDWDGVFELKEK